MSGQMRQISISEFGGPQVLREVHAELPQIAATEVLVRVEAAGVNRPDVVQRLGFYAPPPGVSEVPGLEVAGVIVAIGTLVQRWRVGDVVCALVAGGGYAEYVAVPAAQCLPLPRGLSMIEAAALPETAFTVWSNVFERGALVRGETLLVHGGSSGIGTMAIQLGRARGVRVIATAGSAAKCQVCEQLGAELAINYREQDFVAAVRGFGDGHGADVILDMVGAGYMQRNITAAAVDGRIVQIAFLQGSRIELELMPLMLKRLILTGSTLRARSLEFKGALARAVEQNVWPLVESARLRPVIHQVFPLAEAAAAHALMESGTHIGKIVLQVSGEQRR